MKHPHPGASDLDEEKTRFHIYMVADVLGKIGRPEEKEAVESIRDALFAAPSPATLPEQEQTHETQGAF